MQFFKLHEFHIVTLTSNRGIYDHIDLVSLREKSSHQVVIGLKIKAFCDSCRVLYSSGSHSLSFAVNSHKHHRDLSKHIISVVYGISKGRIIRHHQKVILYLRKELVPKILIKGLNILSSIIFLSIHELIVDFYIDALKSFFKTLKLWWY